MAAEGALALDGVELRSTPTRSGVASFLMRPIEGASAILYWRLLPSCSLASCRDIF